MPDDALAAAVAHACGAWPLEACGVVIREPGGLHRFIAVTNVASDPARRFELAPHEQLAIWKRAAAGAFALVAIVHSHPNAPADFSREDREAATLPGGHPLHPGLEQWVLSIHSPRPRLVEAKAYTWRMGCWDGRALGRSRLARSQICITGQKRL